MQYYWVTL